MNKIIEVALAGKFDAQSVPSIMEIIGATPNPEMATEILLGVYEEPLLDKEVKRNGTLLSLISVDFWRDRVDYSYQEEVTIGFYVDKDLDQSLVTLENYKQYKKEYRDDNVTHMTLKTGELALRKSDCSISTWRSYDKLPKKGK